MYPALYIEEILLHIFSYCHIYSLHRARRGLRQDKSPCGNSDLAVLARTCRTFKEPALDMLWAELDDMSPLVRCLPKSSWPISGPTYSLRKPIEPNDWEVILSYTRRVREFTLLKRSFCLTRIAIGALSNPPPSMEPIFPNLRSLSLSSPAPEVAPLVRHLMNPNLVHLWFQYTSTLTNPLLLQGFGEKCPLVTSFRGYTAGLDDVSGLICHWKHLYLVEIYDESVNADTLIHLSRLPSLHHLVLQLNNAAVDQICASQSTVLTFPALHHLRLNNCSLHPLWMLLRHSRLPMVHDISLSLNSRPNLFELASIFVSLQEACACDSLENIYLYPSRFFNFDSPVPLEDPSLTLNHLRPLLVFVNIKCIHLDIARGVDLYEHELLSLASAWPNLEAFEVGEYYDWTESSGVTPGGFVQLLEQCRSLVTFNCKFNIQGYTEIPQGHPWRGLKLREDAVVNVLKSPIEEVSIEALAVFFHVAPYPKFILATYWVPSISHDLQPPDEGWEKYSERWTKVQSMAQTFWSQRQELNRSLGDPSSWKLRSCQ